MLVLIFSYAGLNGVPSCANDFLLNDVIRTKFGRPDVVVGTDCGAVNNMVKANKFVSSACVFWELLCVRQLM